MMAQLPLELHQTVNKKCILSRYKRYMVQFPWQAGLLLLPFFLLFMVFQVAPMVWVLINSFIDQDEGSLANFIEIFTNDFYLQAFQNTFWLALFSSVAGLLIATLTAFSLYRI